MGPTNSNKITHVLHFQLIQHIKPSIPTHIEIVLHKFLSESTQPSNSSFSTQNRTSINQLRIPFLLMITTKLSNILRALLLIFITAQNILNKHQFQLIQTDMEDTLHTPYIHLKA